MREHYGEVCQLAYIVQNPPGREGTRSRQPYPFCTLQWNIHVQLYPLGPPQLRYTVKKVYDLPVLSGGHQPNFRWPGIIKIFPARESLISDVPAGDGKTANLFLQCNRLKLLPSFLNFSNKMARPCWWTRMEISCYESWSGSGSALILSGWIRIRKDKKDTQKRTKWRNFMFSFEMIT
jgi:hypothetical protein